MKTKGEPGFRVFKKGELSGAERGTLNVVPGPGALGLMPIAPGGWYIRSLAEGETEARGHLAMWQKPWLARGRSRIRTQVSLAAETVPFLWTLAGLNPVFPPPLQTHRELARFAHAECRGHGALHRPPKAVSAPGHGRGHGWWVGERPLPLGCPGHFPPPFLS